MLPSLIGVLLCCLQGPVLGQKLSGPVTVTNGGVLDFRFAGQRVVYWALLDSSTSGLYATELGAGFPTQPVYTPATGVSGFEMDSIGKLVLFRAGGAMLALLPDGVTPPVTVHSGAPLFTRPTQRVPGDEYVVYFAGVGGPIHLYRGRVDGSEPPVVLAGPFFSFVDPVVSADGTTVLFATRASSAVGYDVQSVPVRGGPVVSVSRGPLPFPSSSPLLALSGDGRRALYLKDVAANLRPELFAAPSDGTRAPLRMHRPLASGEGVGEYFDPLSGGIYEHLPAFALHPDGTRVAFFALLRRRQTRFHLLETPLTGALHAQRLASWDWPLQPNDDGFTLGGLAFDPSGRWLVYQEIAVNDFPFGRGRLKTVWAKGGQAPVDLTDGLLAPLSGLPEPSFERPSFRFSEDGSRVVFLVEQSLGSFLIYSAPVDGSAPAVLLAALPAGRRVLRYEVCGSSVLYLGNPGPTAAFELFQVPVAGGAPPVRLNGMLPTGGSVSFFRARPGEVAYVADQDVRGRRELYYSTF